MSLEQFKNSISGRDLEKQVDNEFKESTEYKSKAPEVLKPDVAFIEKTTLTSLIEQNRAMEMKSLANSEANENKHEGLTEDEKAKVREAHPDWPDEIIDAIGSMKEYEIYDKANLTVEYVNGRPCLVRSDIDMDQKDIKGRTNHERMEEGLAPLDKDGNPIHLHHIGQHMDSPLAELTVKEHCQDGNDTILHDKKKETEVHGEGSKWPQEKEAHWEARSQQNERGI